MLADKALCRFDSIAVVGANEWFESYEMSIVPDDVSSVLCHPNSPLPDGDGMAADFVECVLGTFRPSFFDVQDRSIMYNWMQYCMPEEEAQQLPLRSRLFKRGAQSHREVRRRVL
jgi:hypothetical protein